MRIGSRGFDVVRAVVLIIFLIWCFLPIYLTITTAFKNRLEVFGIPPTWIFTPTLENFQNLVIYRAGEVPKNILNSGIIAIITTAIAMAVGVPSAYAFSRWDFPGRRTMIIYILASRMIPDVIIVIPYFLMFMRLGLIDSYPALIIVYIAFNLPLVIFMMTAFIQEVPIELDESAMIDGCTRLTAFFRVVLPNARGGLASAAIFCILGCWNEFLYALVLTGIKAKTAPVAIYGFLSGAMYFTMWGEMCALATVIILPVAIFALAVQKHIVRGFTLGAVKG